MITIELMGGLGNQLFQIFALMAYSMENKTSFYIEDKEIVHGVRKIHYWDNILSNIGKFRKPVINSIYAIKEKGFDYTHLPELKNKTDNVKMIGYFQSYKYFHNHYTDILKYIKLDDKKKDYSDMYDYQYTISLHFRVGDYKELQEHHPLLKPQYYINALDYIMKISDRTNWQVLYFCEEEDVDYVNEQINIIQEALPTLSFIKIESNYKDWEQMLIMSLCKHNVIANSSFSWWGAYLNTGDNLVCYPQTWFGPAQGLKNMNDMFPGSWTRINE